MSKPDKWEKDREAKRRTFRKMPRMWLLGRMESLGVVYERFRLAADVTSGHWSLVPVVPWPGQREALKEAEESIKAAAYHAGEEIRLVREELARREEQDS